MNITRIQLPTYNLANQSPDKYSSFRTGVVSTSKSCETVTKDSFEYSKPSREVNFKGGFCFSDNKFAQVFPKSFFNKIVESGIHCAYTGIKLVSQKDWDALISSHVLEKKGPVAVKFLKKFEKSMYDIEHQVFSMLEKTAKKHPKLDLQELLRLNYHKAEYILAQEQEYIMHEMLDMISPIPNAQTKEIRKLIDKSLQQIREKSSLPENRFRKKEFMYRLSEIKFGNPLLNKYMKNKLLSLANELPASSTSVNAFIVKYSQPYKVKYTGNDEVIKIPITPQDLGLSFIKPALRTDDHIYPQRLFKIEEQARKKGSKKAKKLSDFRVTILTSGRINTEKSDTLIDDFIGKTKRYRVPENIRNHIEELIELNKKWLQQKRIPDTIKLTEYIMALKEEFNIRSNIVNIDIKSLKKILPRIKAEESKFYAILQKSNHKLGNNIFEYTHKPRYTS